MSKKRVACILVAILFLAGFLRLYGLSRGDPISDEVLIAFRGIGMMDFDEGDFQTTPLEWFGGPGQTIPWWTGLSFHDHPIGAFLAQNISMNFFGENPLAFRLPSVIFGLGSIYLVFLIGSVLFSSEIGLISALLMAVGVNHVYVSRIGLQESYVIFFILLSIFYFIKAEKKSRYLIYSGIALGLGLLTKYTAGIVFPIFLTYALISKREYFKKTKFWLGGLIALLIFSPVIVYNIEMYRAVGHFDFQISYVVGERPAEWQVQPGKEIGSLSDRISNYLPGLASSNSWPLLALFGTSATVLLYFALRNKFKNLPYGDSMKFFLTAFFWMTFLMLAIGPQLRFLTMLEPFICLSVGLLIYTVYKNLSNKRIFFRTSAYVIFSTFLLFEVFYSWNSEIRLYPIGDMGAMWSRLRFENYNWGYNELGAFLAKELDGKMPAITFDLRYNFLDKLRDKIVAADTNSGLELYPAFFVYDGNLDQAGKLWTLDRLHIYHGWPIISLDTYQKMLHDNGQDFFKKSGFKVSYFIFMKNKVPNQNDQVLMKDGTLIPVKNPRGDEVFDVYKKSL